MRYYIENKSYQYFVGTFSSLSDDPHIHSHLEMIYLTHGTANGCVDGIWYPIKKGDLFLAGANQIHSYSYDGDVSFYLIIFTPEMEQLLNEYLKEKLPVSHVISAESLYPGMDQILQRIAINRKAENPFQRLEATGDFLSFLGKVLPHYRFSDSGVTQDSVHAILAYCAEHFREPITLESVAKELHLSKYYISHIFRQRMDLSFLEFLNSLRTDYARQHLMQGNTVTDTAYAAGFSSIRTFNRVFRQKYGCSPRAYLKAQTTK